MPRFYIILLGLLTFFTCAICSTTLWASCTEPFAVFVDGSARGNSDAMAVFTFDTLSVHSIAIKPLVAPEAQPRCIALFSDGQKLIPSSSQWQVVADVLSNDEHSPSVPSSHPLELGLFLNSL